MSFVRLLDVPCRVDELIPEWLNLPTRSSRCLRVMLDLPSGFMWSLRYRERQRFSTRPIVLPFIYDCYVQHWGIHMARCRAHRHLLNSAIMVCLMGHIAVQTSVAEGFLAFEATIRMARSRWFEENMGSEVVSWFVVAHVPWIKLLGCSRALWIRTVKS